MEIGTRVRRTINDRTEGRILSVGEENVVVEGLWYVVHWDDGQITQVHESTLEVIEEELPRTLVIIKRKDGSFAVDRFVSWEMAVAFAERTARWSSVEKVGVSRHHADGGVSHLTITGANG